MAISHYRSKRSSTGARYIKSRKKRSYESGSRPTLTKLGERKVRTTRTAGGNQKARILSSNEVNLFDPKAKKAIKANILNIVENPANRHYVRRNIMTRGTVIETDKGKAKVTNRPGQEGHVNATLV